MILKKPVSGQNSIFLTKICVKTHFTFECPHLSHKHYFVSVDLVFMYEWKWDLVKLLHFSRWTGPQVNKIGMWHCSWVFHWLTVRRFRRTFVVVALCLYFFNKFLPGSTKTTFCKVHSGRFHFLFLKFYEKFRKWHNRLTGVVRS